MILEKHFNFSDEEINYYEKIMNIVFILKKGTNLSEEDWKKYTELHFSIVPNLKLILNDSKQKLLCM